MYCINDNFKAGFLKQASLLALVFGPSISKRAVGGIFEYSKKKALGIPAKSSVFSPLLKKINSDIDFVNKLPDGPRKKINQFLFNEGPAAGLYAPAMAGRELGHSLSKITYRFPQAKNFLDNLTSLDSTRRGLALNKLKDIEKKINSPITKERLGIGLGAAGVLGLSKLKKEGG